MDYLKARPIRIIGAIGVAALLIYLLVLPQLSGTEDARLFTLTLMFTTIGISINWNLTGGFTGYVDFGHVAWFGIGAYVTAIMMSRQSDWVPQELPLIPSVLVGAFVAGLIAYFVGRKTMRLSGPYFSIAMLGFAVFMREVVRISRPLTNGGVGLTLPPSLNRPLWYYVELFMIIGLIGVSWWLRRSRFGGSLIAIREDEVGAEMRGIDTERNKTLIFAFSAFSTGVFGGIWAYQNTFVDPDIAFFETRTLDAVLSTMFGGIGTVAGPVVGSVALYWMREVLWANLLDFHLIAQGLILGLIVLYLPQGLVGLFDPKAETSHWVRERLGLKSKRTSTFDGMTSMLDEDESEAPTSGDASEDAAEDREHAADAADAEARP